MTDKSSLIGMLWFDNTVKPLDQKVRQAAAYYTSKYGLIPDLAFIHPAMLPLPEVVPNSPAEAYTVINPGSTGTVITVVAKKSILPNHIWIGVKPS